MKAALMWAWAHPFSTFGTASLLVFLLIGTEALPLQQPWHGLMLPAYLLQAVLGTVIFELLPFARDAELRGKLAYFLILIPLYFGVLMGADALLVWRKSTPRASGRGGTGTGPEL